MSFVSRWYRNRAMVGALFVAVFLIWAFANKKNLIISEVREKKEVMAEVLSVTFVGKAEFKRIKASFKLPDGTETTLDLLPKLAPREGEKIPLEIWVRASGKTDYHLNREQWEKLRNAQSN